MGMCLWGGSPLKGEPPSMHWTPTTRLRQGRSREGLSEGSRRQSCEPLSADKAGRNTNVIEGRPACAVSTADRHPRGESVQHDKALWFGGHGKWRGSSSDSTCPYPGRSARLAASGRQGSRTEAQPERAGEATGPYRGPGSASRSNPGRDRAEVSRGHSTSLVEEGRAEPGGPGIEFSAGSRRR